MNRNPDWPSVLRLVWLTGGLVAVNEPDSKLVSIHTNVNGRMLAGFDIIKYGAIFPGLTLRGFKIIGATFVTDPEQLDGMRAPEFRMAGLENKWNLWDTFQAWRNIAAAAARANDMILLDVSARIAAGLQFSEMRLYDLAMAYSAQLHAHLRDGLPKEEQAFQDTFSPGVYKNISSLFWELAVLRDVLAQFVGTFCLRRDGITTISGLRKSLKTESSSDPEANEFLRLSDKTTSGWMATFGAYRDCFTHSAPLHNVEGLAWTIQDLLKLRDGKSLPQIYYPLPPDVEELSRRRSKGPLFRSFAEMALNAGRKRHRSTEPDALEYLHGCLSRFTDLAARLVSRSPVAPKRVIITKQDIIGDIKVTYR